MYIRSLRGLGLNEDFGSPDTIMSYSPPAPVYSQPAPSYDNSEGLWQPDGWNAPVKTWDAAPVGYNDSPVFTASGSMTPIPTQSRTVSAPASSPSASNGGFDWASFLKTAVTTYGTVAVERSRAESQTARTALTNRYPSSPTPSYSPFPGRGYATGSDPMQVSTTGLIVGGLLLAGVAYALTRS